MHPVDILIENAILMTMNSEREIIEDGFIAIVDTKIIDIGKQGDTRRDYKPNVVIDARGSPILPGFVNTHHHFFSTYFRGSPYMHGEGDLFDFIRNVYAKGISNANREDCYYAALLGSVEMIRSGITCAIDVNGWSSLEATEAALDAFNVVGIRGTEARLVLDRDLWDMGLPYMKDTRKAVDETIHLIEEWRGNDRIRVWFHPTYPPHCSDELLVRLSKVAQEMNVGISIHLHEEKEEVASWKEMTGLSPIQYYYQHNIGLLAKSTIATHCVWVDDREIEILRETGTPVSHNPVTNLYSAGIAPIPKLLEAKVTVGLGTDDAFGDMFELMKTTALVHKLPSGDTSVVSPEKVLEMATIDGAKVMGLDDEIGSIEIGKTADLVMLNLKQPNTTPISEPLSYLIVYCGKPGNVDTVIINGKIVLREGRMMTVDEADVIEKTQQSMDRIYLA